MVETLSTKNAKTFMRDYRDYKQLYKLVGFFIILIAVFTLSFKVTSWFVWAHQCINASIQHEQKR